MSLNKIFFIIFNIIIHILHNLVLKYIELYKKIIFNIMIITVYMRFWYARISLKLCKKLIFLNLIFSIMPDKILMKHDSGHKKMFKLCIKISLIASKFKIH